MPKELMLDDLLITKAIEAGRHETAEEAVSAALQEYVSRHGSDSKDAPDGRHAGILEWVGKVEYYDDYDHKELRRRKVS
jgi:Arc/MetJ family transcription regulator